jgi:hypothetical protein
LNYRNQWFYSKDAYTEIKKALKTIKIWFPPLSQFNVII